MCYEFGNPDSLGDCWRLRQLRLGAGLEMGSNSEELFFQTLHGHQNNVTKQVNRKQICVQRLIFNHLTVI